MTRSFRMGFTPLPFDVGADALDETYRFIAEHGDLIAHHFDEGIPWQSAYDGAPFPDEVRTSLDDRLRRRREGQSVLLAVSAVGGDRTNLAAPWGEDGGRWSRRSYDDVDVVRAYTAFCKRMVDEFRPDWFAYGIETNIVARAPGDLFERYVAMCARVYAELKDAYPALPCFVTMQLEHLIGRDPRQEEAFAALMRVSDVLAISSYAFMGAGFAPTPASAPGTWSLDHYDRLRELAGDKPFGVAETGFLAETIAISSMNLETEGRPEWQAAYVDALLRKLDELNASFLIWFVPRDYDALWRAIAERSPDFFELWRTTGLADANGDRRPALEIWDAWLARGG